LFTKSFCSTIAVRVAWAPLADLLLALFRATTTITATAITAAAIISRSRRCWGGGGAVSGTGTGPGAGAGLTAGAGATSATLKSNDGLSTFHTYLYSRTATNTGDIRLQATVIPATCGPGSTTIGQLQLFINTFSKALLLFLRW
jgi:hypothetical protein